MASTGAPAQDPYQPQQPLTDIRSQIEDLPAGFTMSSADERPALPVRPEQQAHTNEYITAEHTGQSLGVQTFPPPPQRRSVDQQQDITSPIHYSRDPHKLVAYLVPFPKPKLNKTSDDSVPSRFLIYTPPPPPLSAPKEGDKESKVHKVQRKWEEEVRAAKTSNAKNMSWHGVKGKATKGISWAMSQTKTSNLEFLNRIGANPEQSQPGKHAEDGVAEDAQTKATVKLEEMLLVYPSSMGDDSEAIKTEFINTMMRSKSKAERDAIIATGLLPVSAAIDILATLVWPFGGLLEIDAVWAYSSIRGAKTSRSVTKRLASDHGSEEDKLALAFTPSPRLTVLERYLAHRCHEYDGKMFPSAGAAVPTETQVLEAIGWTPSSTGSEVKNWEDEQWEITEVKDDLKQVMGKGAKEWAKWARLYAAKPEKALKK